MEGQMRWRTSRLEVQGAPGVMLWAEGEVTRAEFSTTFS